MKKTTSLLVGLMAILITVAAVWYLHRPYIPEDATWEDVVEEAKTGGYQLITTQELYERYKEESSDILVVDTRQQWEYRSAHIKGAENFPMEPGWWAQWRKGGQLEDFLGPDKQRDIVFY